jgi:hypothetical protein
MTNRKHKKGMSLQQRDDSETGTTTTKKWHTTHTQPHKPLLVGWIVCGMTTTTNNDEQQQQNDGTTMAQQLTTGR